jgi:CDP-diacylglycerol--glycerol-3-phosphate 3-phosphatidyltransferase
MTVKKSNMPGQIMNLPNKITISRIALIPLFVASFYLKFEYMKELAAIVFLVASITDILDGWIARKYNLVTNVGKLIDPIADKLLTFSAFIMLAHIGLISPIAVIIVMARELLVSGIRMIAVEGGTVIAASIWGKLKTISQCLAVIFILLWERIFFVSFPLEQVVLWVSVAITIWSGIDYTVKYAETLVTSNKRARVKEKLFHP